MARTMDGQFADREDRIRKIRRIHGIARLMDTAIQIPGTRIRFGADSVIGLIPGIGDAGGAVIGLFIVNEARRLGLPNHKLVAMLANIGFDTFGGSIPIIGDLFDIYYKSNWRNLEIVLDHFGMTIEDLRRLR
jgi:hypothetical protein